MAKDCDLWGAASSHPGGARGGLGSIVESREDVAGASWGIKDFPRSLNHGNIGHGQSYSVFENFQRGNLSSKQ